MKLRNKLLTLAMITMFIGIMNPGNTLAGQYENQVTITIKKVGLWKDGDGGPSTQNYYKLDGSKNSLNQWLYGVYIECGGNGAYYCPGGRINTNDKTYTRIFYGTGSHTYRLEMWDDDVWSSDDWLVKADITVSFGDKSGEGWIPDCYGSNCFSEDSFPSGVTASMVSTHISSSRNSANYSYRNYNSLYIYVQVVTTWVGWGE